MQATYRLLSILGLVSVLACAPIAGNTPRAAAPAASAPASAAPTNPALDQLIALHDARAV